MPVSIVVCLVAFVTPVAAVEKNVGFGDDKEVAGIFLFIVVIIKVQNLRIIQFNANYSYVIN